MASARRCQCFQLRPPQLKVCLPKAQTTETQ
jgi:hypothetical protein